MISPARIAPADGATLPASRPHASLPAVELTGADLGVADLVQIARDPGTTVRVSGAACARVAAARVHIEAAVTRYRIACDTSDAADLARRHVYGVTTGFGAFKYAAISPVELRQLQVNLVRSHAVGVGRTSDSDDPENYVPAEVVRAALALRLNSFLKGLSGVRPPLVRALQELLNAGVIPLAPTRGSLGASGDLCPLAHMALVLLGEGRFYVVRTTDEVRRGPRGATLYAATALPEVCPTLAAQLTALEDAGASWPTLPFSCKEGLALINGSTVSAALLALAVHDLDALADVADVAAALTLEALQGQSGAFDPRVHAARPHPGQATVAAHVRTLVTGSTLVDSAPEHVQDAYSLRCVPQVHGASREAFGYTRSVVERELNAATDNPLLFERVGDGAGAVGDDSLEGGSEALDVVSGGNFHGQPVALAADFAAIAAAELGSIAERRVQMLLDAHHSRGLPANLTRAPGLQSGLMIAQYTAASLVSENKGRCHPASVDSIPTSANSEDHNSMAMIAARKLRSVVTNVEAVLAIELLAAAQAVELRAESLLAAGTCEAGRTNRSSPDCAVAAHLGVGTEAAYRAIRMASAPITVDRSLEPDIRAVRKQIARGELLDRVTHALHTATEPEARAARRRACDDGPAARGEATSAHIPAHHADLPTPFHVSPGARA